jgi:hypothetical protein
MADIAPTWPGRQGKAFSALPMSWRRFSKAAQRSSVGLETCARLRKPSTCSHTRPCSIRPSPASWRILSSRMLQGQTASTANPFPCWVGCPRSTQLTRA